MARTNSPLHDLRVASPCPAAWERMEGNDRVRFCDACALNVYNLSAMTAQEAERLVVRKEGRLCVRFYQREDGTVITEDCPRGLAAVRRATRRAPLVIGGAVAAMLLLLFGLVGAAVGLTNRSGASLSNVQPFKAINGWLNGSSGGTPTGAPVEVTGEICPQDPEQPDPAPPR